MANKSLTDLTARTATADTDLIHVNSGGTDYKETKANFLSNITSDISSINSSLTKSSVTATPHASITANRLSAYRVGDLVTVSFNMDSGVDFATNSNLVQLGYGAPALIDFTCMNVTDGTPFQLYMTSGGMIRNGATLPSGKRLIGCFSYAVG